MRKLINRYDNYFIYDNGNVLNIYTNKILQGSIGEQGYKYYRLSKDGKKKMYYVHRLVALHFLDNPHNFPVVNHKDGNKLNNCVENLEWTSYSQNVKHAYKNNLIKEKRKSEYYKQPLENEKWKKIPDFHYSVSNMGRVKNDITNLLLKGSITCGYYKVRLSNNGKVYDKVINHLVYCVFNELNKIPKGYVIDHINGIKTDDRLDNLRLITLSENVNAALYKTKTNLSCQKVMQMTLDDKPIQQFSSCSQAARILELDQSTISKVCRGINKSHGGFHFKYVN